ncbi:bifunctional 4-hydroxy-2-oxoglutarate aldolase/2-dehydro-3-deoxy-phosphogluconate aldolase [Sinomicrobium sp. M5D2P17]
MDNSFSWELFERIPIIGILRNFPFSQIESMSECYARAGLTNLEVTMNSKNAVETISFLKNKMQGRLNIGAGTVCTMEDLDRALEAGSEFIVTPIIEEKIIQECVENSIPVFPGAYTPTEIYKAWSLGASMVKVFPAFKLGPDYIKQVLAPLNQIKLLPTGGVSIENMEDFFRAGAKGVGVGSQLIPGDLVDKNEWELLSLHFSKFINKYKTISDED